MDTRHDNMAGHGLRAWWAAPPRTGLRRIIAPWAYRHLQGFARVRIAVGIILVGIGLVTLVAGSFTAEAATYAFAFLAAGAASLAIAAWYLAIARGRARVRG